MEKIIIFDTTLRDGEQAAGAGMTIAEKVLIAKNLEFMGVDVIEAGFAASSPSEFEAISKISKVCQKSIICSLARAKKEDILSAFNAIKDANFKRIHTFISTSDIHIKHKLKKTNGEVIEMIKSSVSYAKSLTDDIEWSAEDATRTNFDFLCQCVEMAINNGATTINIPDTVGYSMPEEYCSLIQKLTNQFSNTIFSTHCHNDLGLATANTLAGINGGARQIECTINGIGERAGNTALEEIAMSFKVRNDLLKYHTNINTQHITTISALVSNITGFIVQKNKAIVGLNAFAHASGIHQDGMLKNSETYQIMDPKDIGLAQSSLTLGKLSGKAALNDKLKQLGFNVDNTELDELFIRFKKLSDSKKIIYDSDILSIISNNITEISDDKILSYQVEHQDGIVMTTIKMQLNGEIKEEKLSSNSGILDSCFKCINKIMNIDPKLEEYDLKAVTSDTDSQGFANVVISYNGIKYSGKGYDIDVVLSSLKAYFNACLKKIN